MTHFTNMYHSGDPYVGLRLQEMKEKNNKISDLEKDVKRLKAELAHYERRYGVGQLMV